MLHKDWYNGIEQQSQIKRDHENTETVVSKKTITQLVH